MAIKTIDGVFAKIEIQADKTKLFTIDLAEELDFESGQFINLIFDFEGERYMKPYSIASSNMSKKRIELSINLVEEGRATPKLFQKKVGDSCQIKGPLGLFKFNPESTKEKIVLIGTGTGIAPLRSILFELLTDTVSEREIILLFGSRYDSEVLFEAEFSDLEDLNSNFRFIKVISRPSDKWEGRTGYVQDNLDMIDCLNSQVYICGRPEMVSAVKDRLNINGCDVEEIYTEKYV